MSIINLINSFLFLIPSIVSFGPPIISGFVSDARLAEKSGLAPSWRNPGVLWINNDSGNTNQIFAINTKGNLLAIFTLNGAVNNDWEDIAVGPGPAEGKGYVYVAEHNGTLYRKLEPYVNQTVPSTVPVKEVNKVVRLRFQFKRKDGSIDHPNCEAVMIDPITSDLFFIPRGPEGSIRRPVYWAPNIRNLDDSIVHTLTEIVTITNLDPTSTVTSADISKDGKYIAILQHQRVSIWMRPIGQTSRDAFLMRDNPDIIISSPVSLGEAMGFALDVSGFYAVRESMKREGGPNKLWFFPKKD